jgi:hypothetical protein
MDACAAARDDSAATAPPTDNPRNSRRFIPNLLTIMRATLREHPMSG